MNPPSAEPVTLAISRSRADGLVSRDRLHSLSVGRAIRFDEGTRSPVLDLLLLYEETMLSGGLLDELSLTLTVLPHLSKLNALPPELGFRCLLVDEFQDLSTRDLALLRRIAGTRENNLFFEETQCSGFS